MYPRFHCVANTSLAEKLKYDNKDMKKSVLVKEGEFIHYEKKLLKKFKKEIEKICTIFLIFIWIFHVVDSTSAGEKKTIDLIIQNVCIPQPIIESDDITIKVTIKNNNTWDIPPGTSIKVNLYINDEDTPKSSNISTNGLPRGTFCSLNLIWTAELDDKKLTVVLFYQNIETDRWEESITVYERGIDIKLNTIHIEEDIKLGITTIIYANISNIGRNIVENVKVALYIDEVQRKNITLHGLSRGETKNISLEWTPMNLGFHTVNVSIDPKNTIEEKNENNNYYETNVVVKPYRLKWWNAGWHYRKFYAINGTGNVSTSVNFTKLLNDLGIKGKTFENNSVTIVKYSSAGSIEKIVSEYNFDEDRSFDNKTNAVGVLSWNVSEEPSYYYIYFDVKENKRRRRYYDETDTIRVSGKANVGFETNVEGWWAELILPDRDFYALYTTVNFKIVTTAEAHNAIVELYRDGKYVETIHFETRDNTTWFKNYIFKDEGTWRCRIITWDNSDFEPTYIVLEKLTVEALPDLAVLEIKSPSEIIEGETAEITAVLKNKGHADARNYQVRLYLAQRTMNWKKAQLKNTVKVNIDVNETIEVSLTWKTALYGDPAEKGSWIVGIWIYTNDTFKDRDVSNNRCTAELKIKEGEKNPPIIKIIMVTDKQERKLPVDIVAEVKDESGIKKVTITIEDPKNNNYLATMTSRHSRYSYKFEETQIIGTYNFSITAVDNSFYQTESTVSGVFEIIEDATPPSIRRPRAFPRVQLRNRNVNITCVSQDHIEVKSVLVTITYPDTYSITKTMKIRHGKYFYNQTYELVGRYLFYITSEDPAGNINKTGTKEFWITDDLSDSDSDGMPDWWEEKHDFNPYNQADAKGDRDGDGVTNVNEYKTRTNPLKKPPFAQRITHSLKENIGYLIVSSAFFILITSLSIKYGKKREEKNDFH
jgi:hypothetical protein